LNRECRRSACSVAVLLILAASGAWAQLEITSSPNVVGSGARALGMGGAFIAVADDATAASWNPGGLTQLERPEISLVLSHKWLREDFRSGSHPELSGSHRVSFADVNYLSVVYPIPRTLGGRNFVLSLNYQRKYDFDRDLNLQFNSIAALRGGNIVDSMQFVDYKQRGSLAALSPAFGFELSQRVSVGVVMNIYDQSLLSNNGWETRQNFRVRTRINGQYLPTSWTQLNVREEFDNFSGTNYTFGMLWRATEHLNIGAVYHSKLSATVDYSRTERAVVSGVGGGFPLRESRRQRYTFPSAVGVGAAYRFPNDRLTLAVDVTRREWSQFIIDDPQFRRLFLRRRSGVTGIAARDSKVRPTYTVRTGAEYVFIDDTRAVQNLLPSLRFGLFYDPEPAGGRKDFLTGVLTEGDGKPDDYFGVTLGAGVLIRNRVNIDAAYTYRWGTGARKDTFRLPATDARVDQHLLYLSTVIYF